MKRAHHVLQCIYEAEHAMSPSYLKAWIHAGTHEIHEFPVTEFHIHNNPLFPLGHHGTMEEMDDAFHDGWVRVAYRHTGDITSYGGRTLSVLRAIRGYLLDHDVDPHTDVYWEDKEVQGTYHYILAEMGIPSRMKKKRKKGEW